MILRFLAENFWHSPNGPARMATRCPVDGPGSIRHLLAVGGPMIVSSLSGALNMFLDRLFLAWYDRTDHMTASLMGGVTWFLSIQLFFGIVTYASTFVAQYHGARHDERIGRVIWQSIYLSLFGGVLFVALAPFWPTVFELAGHRPVLAALEADYCRILSYGAGALLLGQGISAFFTGRGKTVIVMVVSGVSACVNVLLNWWFIFSPPGWLPFIDPGVAGAAWATTMTFSGTGLVYVVLVMRGRHQGMYRMLTSWRLDWREMRRLVWFGLPQSVHQALDIAAFTAFMLIIGRRGEEAAAATTIALNINLLTFHPMVGFSGAVSVLVGQFIGAQRAHLAERITFVGLVVSLGYAVCVAIGYVVFADWLILLYATEGETLASMGATAEMARLFLYFAAVYTLSDGIAVTYAGAIKGAGDMKMFMVISAVNGIGFMVIPLMIAEYLQSTATTLWVLLTVYICGYGFFNALRYRSGAWKTMSLVNPKSSHA